MNSHTPTSAPAAVAASRARLPHARHLARVPAEIGPDALARLQLAAAMLPQVVEPADFADEHGPGTDHQLDDQGYIQLQRAVAGVRPSRWIAPRDLQPALQHLDQVGQGADARARLRERQAVLDELNITRHAARFERRLSQPLDLGVGAVLPLAYRQAVDPDALWAFLRTGNRAAFESALGAPPGHPGAEAVAAALRPLVEAGRAAHPGQWPVLVQRLQAECERALDTESLQGAALRVHERWLRQAAQQITLDGLHDELAFSGYPDSFTAARRLQRRVTLYVGPPNSGKTHAAFDRLALAQDGCYLAPLRLLALEGRDRLAARGVSCSLLTGEEDDPAPDARAVSSTIEMVDTTRVREVAVIDEAQMLFDSARGWAWTQAIVGVPARELVIICSSYAAAAIENLVHLCGEACQVQVFERKQHVQVLPAPVPAGGLRRGDALVAFSRRDVLMLRDQVLADGHPVAVIYGALPPEVRRREAERFATGQAHILVATDAIGMGLNLPIRRVLFSTMQKFDGVSDRPLEVSEVHQIAGRAGRYGLHEEGFTGVLREAEPGAGRLLRELLERTPRAPRDFKVRVAPGWWHVKTIGERLGLDALAAVLKVFVQQLRLDDAHFTVADLEPMLALAEQLDHSAAGLGLRERFIYAQAPVDTRADAQVQAYLDWSWHHAGEGRAPRPWFLDEVDEHSRLDEMERALRACTLWLWLDLRFPGAYGLEDAVLDLRERLNEGIERHLKGRKPLWRRR